MSGARDEVMAMRRWWSIGVGIVLFAGLWPETAAGQLASRPAEDWIRTLESPARVAGLRIDEVIGRLGLTPGDVVADLGAGSGLFAFPLAKAVGPGRVYAVELDEGFLTHMRTKAKAEGVANIVPVLGQFTDPSLPARDVDRYLKPRGRIVVIGLHPAQSPHRDQPEFIVSKEQATAWLAEAGFVPAEDISLFDDKRFVVFRRR
jgi:SAM-dependent methyltransferase